MKFLFVFVFGTILLLSTGALAQETQISVTPAIVDVPVTAGQSVTRIIRITNGSDQALPVSVEVQSALLDSDLVDGADSERYKVQQWVRFDQPTYLFGPGQTLEIPFIITAPLTALPGGHYAQINIRGLQLEKDSSDQTTGIIFPEVGVPLLITVPGEIVEDARVVEDDIFPLFIATNSNITTNFLLENSGTVHNLVLARLIVEKNGELIKEVQIQPSVVLPATQKSIEKNWETPGYGSYTLSVELKYGSNSGIFRSKPETVYVTPPLNNLVSLAAVTWTALYIWPRRKHVKAAVNVLFVGK